MIRILLPALIATALPAQNIINTTLVADEGTVDLGPGERLQLSRSQVIRDFSTRRHHPGHHAVELLVNGAVLAVTGFDLGS